MDNWSVGKRLSLDELQLPPKRAKEEPADPAEVQAAIQEFRRVSDQQLADLQATHGYAKDQALHALLTKIRRNCPTPKPEEIPPLQGFNTEGSLRVYILREELAVLRQEGLDTVSAILELAHRMEKAQLKRPSESPLSDSKRVKPLHTDPGPASGWLPPKRQVQNENELSPSAKRLKPSLSLVDQLDFGQDHDRLPPDYDEF